MPKMSKKLGGGLLREIPLASREPMGHAEDYSLFSETESHWIILSKYNLGFRRIILSATLKMKHKVM